MNSKTVVLQYLYNKSCRMEREYKQLRDNVWYRHPDELDLLEQAIAKVRMDTVNEVLGDVYHLLCARDR